MKLKQYLSDLADSRTAAEIHEIRALGENDPDLKPRSVVLVARAAAARFTQLHRRRKGGAK